MTEHEDLSLPPGHDPDIPDVREIRSVDLPADTVRNAGRKLLAEALRSSRARTLEQFDAIVADLGESLVVPYSPQLNPPLWELGHVGWFQDFWIARNCQRARGIACDPGHIRPAGRLPGADALFNSSIVPHQSRWDLPLPNIAQTRAYLEQGLAETLELLSQLPESPESQDSLYFYRLALFHEDMHGEAAVYMAQALDIPLPDGVAARVAQPVGTLRFATADRMLGYDGPGFAFDNELGAHPVTVPAFEIDAGVVTWERYLPFVETTGHPPPRYLRRVQGGWQQRVFGHWRTLLLDAPAVHLSWHDADAWCRWAGRRLPSEAEWEYAALTDPRFGWGAVWEWTSSRFLPYPDFRPHPYVDYSTPWFGDRYVLRGAGPATSPRMAHPCFRNYFTAERNDIHAGFRSCA